MVKHAIYIASTEELSGKSSVTISLALIAKGLGKKVGYFKPIGNASTFSAKEGALDEDVVTMQKLLKLEIEASLICPVILGRGEFLEGFSKIDVSEIIDKIVSSYMKASEDKDIMLIEGPFTLAVGSFLSCQVPKLAAYFGSPVLLIVRFKDDSVVDDILQARDYCMKWDVPILGVVINHVPLSKIEKVWELVKPLLEKNGVKVLGWVPEDKELGALTIREIYDIIGGKVLAGKDGMDRIVQSVLIGAMTPESAMRYFRKAKNELIITGGDRTDIIFAALEVGASALVLTGNLYPSVKIFPRADDLSIPIILVPYDTYTTLQRVQGIVGRIKPEDKKRINRAKRLVEENVDWKKIIQTV